MRLFEIEEKYVNLMGNIVYLLEAYNNPNNQLEVHFNKLHEGNNVFYYNGYINEKSTGDKVVLFNFTIGGNILTVDNIQPIESKIATNKIVHTTIGKQQGAVDMGYTAIKWLFNEIRNFARNLGFNIKKIKSTSRYTGARAKNNPSGKIDNFDVDINLHEQYIYDCETRVLIRLEEYK